LNLNTEDILNTLQLNRPVSIIRAGDGEKIVLNSNKGLNEYKQCINSVMTRQMGYEPVMSDVESIRFNLIEAYSKADIIGVPMHKNLTSLGKHWQDVEKVVKPFSNTTKYCSTDVAYDLLYSGGFEQWLTGKKDLVYISCRNIDEQLKDHFKIQNVHSYIIAPEAKFTTGYAGEPHYPYHFNKMEWFLNSAPCKGAPCLIGAGVIGKIYTNWCRDRGGVAFDIGAVFDLWAGRVTRGPERGLDAIDETYKI